MEDSVPSDVANVAASDAIAPDAADGGTAPDAAPQTLTEDQKLDIISDHLTHASVLEATVAVKARVDEKDIWHRVQVAFAIIALTIVLNYIIAVVQLPQRFPKLFCWQINVYNKLSKCSPKFIDGSYPYGSWAVAVAAVYPPLFSFFELFGAPNLPPQGARFLIRCVTDHGDLITPYMWCGNHVQNNDPVQMNARYKDRYLDGWYDLIPECPSAYSDESKDDIQCTNHDAGQASIDAFVAGWTDFLTSCDCGNSFAAFFPAGIQKSSVFKEALSIPAVRNLVGVQKGANRRYATDIGLLYSGGLVAVAQSLSLTFQAGDEIYKHMFVGDIHTIARASEDCDAAAFQDGLQTGMNTAGGLLGVGSVFGHVGAGAKVQTVLGLGAVSAAGVGMFFWKKNISDARCKAKHLPKGDNPVPCCSGAADLCLTHQFGVPPDQWAQKMQKKCAIGLVDAARGYELCCVRLDNDCSGSCQ